MLVAPIAIALALDVTPASFAAPPYRRVVFKVSLARREELQIQTYGGLVAQDEKGCGPTGQSAGGPAGNPCLYEPGPSAKTVMVLDDGTLSIEFFSTRTGTTTVRVTEALRSRSAPAVFTGTVTPEGVPIFGGQDITILERLTLPFFGRAFGGGQPFSPGTHFNLNISTPNAEVASLFSVTAVAGSDVLLDEIQTVKLTAAKGMDLITRGKVKYDPEAQAPLYGDFEERASRSTVESTDQVVTTLHFERLSDQMSI